MSFTIRPPDGGPGLEQTGAAAPTTHARPAQGPAFARVYELEEARRRREVPLPPIAGDRIPAEVWDEVEAASRLVEDLASRGQRVAFDQDRLTGRIVASLLDETGGTATPVSLGDAVDPRSAATSTSDRAHDRPHHL